MKSVAENKLVVVFRSRLRPDVDLAALEAAGARMYELASAMPGFISYKDFAAEDGECLSIVEFSDMDSLLAWRNQPEHVAMQQRGRDEFFANYEIQVCEPRRAYSFAGKS
jgi:heme-degrading monooxygenase HmoA